MSKSKSRAVRASVFFLPLAKRDARFRAYLLCMLDVGYDLKELRKRLKETHLLSQMLPGGNEFPLLFKNDLI